MMRPLSLWFLSFSVFQPRCKGTPASCGTTGTCGPCFAVCFALVMCKDKACSATHLKTAKSNAKSWIIGHRSLMAMMYWCMYVCVCLSVYLSMYVRTQACMDVCKYIHVISIDIRGDSWCLGQIQGSCIPDTNWCSSCISIFLAAHSISRRSHVDSNGSDPQLLQL